MPQARFLPSPLPPLLFVALTLLTTPAARADEYADVGRMLRSGKSAEALARADRYLSAKPRDPQMRFLRAVILVETGRLADAQAAYAALVQDFPELPEPHNNLAVLYARQNDLAKAKESLQMAIRANPAYATAHENLGDVHLQLAKQSYARAAQLDPASTSARNKLTQAAAASAAPTSPSPRAP